jgi:prephenate dehydrogenase
MAHARQPPDNARKKVTYIGSASESTNHWNAFAFCHGDSDFDSLNAVVLRELVTYTMIKISALGVIACMTEKSTFSFDKVVILGVGLIGGSLARALRERAETGGARRLIGVGQSSESIARALEIGVVDATAVLDDNAALRWALVDADIVMLSVPVAQTKPLLERIRPFLSSATIVTDAGSTKSDVIAAARAALGEQIRQFVPGHPIAGRELTGVDAALPDLYVNRKVVLCALPENSADSVDRISAMWRATGATVHMMPAAQHDRVIASISHLPHVLSFALMEQVLNSPDASLKFALAGGGFRDFTRIAGANPEMWRDICVANRASLLEEIDAYGRVLARLRAAIDAGDGTALEAVFARSRDARISWQALATAAATAASA